MGDGDEAAWVEAHLRPLVGLAPERKAEGDREEVFSAWRRFFESLAEQSPLVLVFEDLHWAGDGLLDFLEHLVGWASGVPLLVLCTARPDLLLQRPAWGSGLERSTMLDLEPLSDADTAELVRELLERPLPSGLERSLLTRAGGNPLYAEEFVRMVAESGLDKSTGELPVPASVQGIIAARLDSLPAGEKAVIQDAAVFGRTFWVGAVGHLGGTAPRTVEQHLRSLERKRLRPPGAPLDGRGGDRVRVPASPRAGRRLRPHPADPPRRQAPSRRRVGRGARPPGDASRDVRIPLLRALEPRAAGKDTRSIASDSPRGARRGRYPCGGAQELRGGGPLVRRRNRALAPRRPRLGTAPLPPRQGPVLLRGIRRGRAHGGADALLAAGDRGGAAEAEVVLGKLAFRQGDGEQSVQRYRDALGILDGEPASGSKAAVLAALARSLSSPRGAPQLRVGRQVADGRGPRPGRGESRRVADHRRRTDRARRDRRPSPPRRGGRARGRGGPRRKPSPSINLADTLSDLGELPRAAELRVEAREVAERLGDVRALRWLDAEHAGELFLAGSFDEAYAITEEFIAESEEAGATTRSPTPE